METVVIDVFVFVKKLLLKLDTDKITVYSAQAAFHIITAFIPFLSFLSLFIRMFIGEGEERFIASVVSFFPGTLGDFVNGILSELFGKTSASVISLSSVVSLWSASKGIFAVRLGLNKVYHIDLKENYVKKRAVAVFYTLIFLLLIVFSLVVLVFGNFFTSLLCNKVPQIAIAIRIVLNFKSVISIMIFTVLFSLLYKYLPYESEKRKLSAQIPGALAASVSWIVFSYFYALYIDNFSSYSYLYGSIGAMVLMLLWVYFCLIMLLFGAEINEFLKDVPLKKKKD